MRGEGEVFFAASLVNIASALVDDLGFVRILLLGSYRDHAGVRDASDGSK